MNPMKIKAPLAEAVMRHAKQNIIPFHMPGHKGGRGFSREFLNNLAEMDVTEIPGMDNLHQPTGIIAEAQRMASRAYRAHHSFSGQWFYFGNPCNDYGCMQSGGSAHSSQEQP